MKGIILGNIWLKVLSVILAFSLWFYVTYRGQSELSVEVPLEFKNMPASLEILKQGIRTSTLNIRGNERLLKELHPKDIRIAIDMTDAKRGESVYYFNMDNVIIPGAIKVLRLDPSSVRVVMDETVVKTLPIKVPLVGSPEKGYRVTSVNVTPSLIEAKGPKTEISQVVFLKTEPIDITGLDAGITQEAHINTNGKNIRPRKQDIVVKIDIERTRK